MIELTITNKFPLRNEIELQDLNGKIYYLKLDHNETTNDFVIGGKFITKVNIGINNPVEKKNE